MSPSDHTSDEGLSGIRISRGAYIRVIRLEGRRHRIACKFRMILLDLQSMTSVLYTSTHYFAPCHSLSSFLSLCNITHYYAIEI